MPDLCFENNVYQVDDFDTVLNTLLKNGHAIPNFCRGGICHSCMMKAEEGTPLPFTQIGLSDELVDENHFLTCQCAVYAPMTIRRPDKDKRTRFVAMVRDKQTLSDGVVNILLSPTHEFVYQAGQNTTLISAEGLSGDFPIASIHGEGNLMEFHIADDKENPLNQYIINELEVGGGLEVMTALGDNYYRESLKGKNLLVVGIDTDIASGLSVIKKALAENHEEKIQLIYGQLATNAGYITSALAAINEKLTHQVLVGNDSDTLITAINRCIASNLSDDTVVLVAASEAMADSIIESCTAAQCLSLSIPLDNVS